MKNLVLVSLMIFAIAVAAIIFSGLFLSKNNQVNIPTNNLTTGFPPVSSSAPASPFSVPSSSISSSGSVFNKKENPGEVSIKNNNAGIILSSEEVAKHDAANDCWMIISSKIYNVSSYVDYHPGGAEAIISYCGKDATAAFTSRHSPRAYNVLKKYYVGELNQQISNN